MKIFLLILLLPLCAAMAQEPPVAEEVPSDISARSLALELAGAFTNDGYRLRDGFWPGEVEPGRPRYLEVNLFAGNDYWFCAAATSPARKLSVSVFDAAGKPVEIESYGDGASAAAGFQPDISGKYFLKLDLLEGEKSPFCLIYAYK
ncbi:MAG: hypothetical protein WEB60_04770 [Terrimicrobiaceae bacterium]